MPQLLSPHSSASAPHKGSIPASRSPHPPQLEKAHVQQQDPVQPKKKKKIKKEEKWSTQRRHFFSLNFSREKFWLSLKFYSVLSFETTSSIPSPTHSLKIFFFPISLTYIFIWLYPGLLNCGVGEDSWESLGLQGIQPVHPKGDQSWIFIGRNDVEAETPVLWPPDAKSLLIGKDPDAGKDWGQEEKGTTEDEMVGWHHWLDRHEFGCGERLERADSGSCLDWFSRVCSQT